MKQLFAASLLALSLLAASVSTAKPDAASEQKRAEAPEQKRAKIDARLKQLRAEILRKEVGLEEAKADQAEKILDRFAAQRAGLRKELRQTQGELEKLLDADSNDQAAYTKTLKALRAAQAELRTLHERELAEVSKLMTPKQQAKFVRALQRAQSRLRAALKTFSAEE